MRIAAVILRDSPDSLTYETAADRTGVLRQGKPPGPFDLSGRAGTGQSFGSVVGDRNRTYAERSAPPA
ncbi:hypothetical protein ACWC9R_20180 [Streptomyces sp. NPDC001219]